MTSSRVRSGRFTRQAAEALAAVLRGKRRIEEIERFLAVPAEKRAPWPALELALAQADLEFLDPASLELLRHRGEAPFPPARTGYHSLVSCRRFAAKTSYLPTPRRASNTAGVQWTARLRQMRIRVGRAPTLNRIEAGKRANSHRAATARSFV